MSQESFLDLQVMVIKIWKIASKEHLKIAERVCRWNKEIMKHIYFVMRFSEVLFIFNQDCINE